MSHLEAAKVFFGSRLQLVLWIHQKEEDELFFQKQFTDETGKKMGELAKQLKKLAAIGMVEELPRARGERAVYWRKLPSPYWKAVEAFLKAAEEIEFAPDKEEKS